MTTQAQQSAARPGIAFGLNAISDWSTQHPFIDLMKTSRPWIGHLPDTWGGWSFQDLMADGFLDQQGWPLALPNEVVRLETRILTDQPETAMSLAGRYHLLFDGDGDIGISERGRVVRKEPGQWVFQYRPGEGSVTISIKETDSQNPIRNIRVVKEDQLEAFQSGQVYNPNWLARLGAVHSLRFMDWMMTNDSQIVSWSDLPKSDDFSYAWRGVPLSDMVALSNQLGADPWFTMPHLANDELIKTFADYVHQELSADRVAHVEYSNEMWNFIFEQAHWARTQAESRWGDLGDGWMQFYGLRAAQVMQIWSDVFGASSEARLKRILSVHTGWPELEKSSLFGASAQAALGSKPLDSFDAYAVTGYFGHELGVSTTLANALNSAEADALKRGQEAGLSRAALRAYVAENRFTVAIPIAAEIVRRGSLREMIEVFWPYHADAARAAGLDLLMYEGGTHAAPLGEAVEDERLSQFLIAFNYSDDMGALYSEAVSAWRDLGGGPFNAFVDVAAPSKWGSWGALRHLEDQNPRWEALRMTQEKPVE
ncbi:hypothetical protein [Marivita sp. S6314]|uniref:hypothetical protein n=1 Tax=Marivita sp. S6314 TaxID=2926406 RepID=UPI001FF3A2C3|nr:hypothetical protein [Marivita sp. S6314]